MSSFFECFNNFVLSSRSLPPQDEMVLKAPSESSSTISVPSELSAGDKMEHSYIREAARTDISNGLAPARTVLLRHPPQCPSCHSLPSYDQESNESQQTHVPAYDEITAKESMNECARIAKYVKNNNSDEVNWETNVNQIGFSPAQKSFFDKVVRILDDDQLARLADDKRQHEAVHRRISVDKSSSRMRRALASVSWEPRLTQWLHMLLMDHLPSTYMASYLDIMQTLKSKLPTLTDKMLFSRPLNNSQELLAPVMKARWEPIVLPKARNFTHNAIIVALPNMPTDPKVPERMQKWYKALSTITEIVQITLPNSNDRIGRQNLDQVSETIVSLIRVRIHELRTENPSRGIILIGFNAGSSLALQVAMSESVACVVCMGFAYNTLRGPRGMPDDRLLDVKAPILFVIGQNSARTSQEEMEGLRERMQSESSLVVVGSADDSLRVPKSKQRIEGVTQSMVDVMIVDEVYEFINKTLNNPPGPRMPITFMNNVQFKQKYAITDGNGNKTNVQGRKRKGEASDEVGSLQAKAKYVPHKARAPRIPKPKPPRLIDPFAAKRKVGRPRTRPLPNVPTGSNSKASNIAYAGKNAQANDELNMSIESILDEALEYDEMMAGDSNSTVSSSNVIKPNSTTMVMSKGGGKPIIVSKPLATINTSGIGGTKLQGSVSLSSGTKIKLIPSNQIVQLPPQNTMINYNLGKGGSGAGQSNAASIGSIVKTGGTGQHIFTLKTPAGQTTQYVAAHPSPGAQKYTVIKTANGTTMLQLAKNVPSPTVSGIAASAAPANSSNLDLSNIIDMPIVFADSEGNIAEQQKQAQSMLETPKNATVNNRDVGNLIINQKIIKEGNTATSTSSVLPKAIGGKPGTIVLNKGLQQVFTTQGNVTSLGGNKVVYLNRGAIKPMVTTARLAGGVGTVQGAGSLPPYTKLIVAAPKATVDGSTSSGLPANLKTVNLQAVRAAGASATPVPGTLRLGNKTYPQFHIISGGSSGTTSTATTATVAGDGKQSIRNLYLKSATGLKPLPVQMLANRPGAVISSGGNPTVRRVLNIGPVTKLATSNTPTESQANLVKVHVPAAPATATTASIAESAESTKPAE